VVATAAVVAAVALVPSPKPEVLPPATSPVPAHFMAVSDGMAAVYGTGKPSDGYQGFNPKDDTVTAVTALGDDFHFWSAAVPATGCRSRFTALEHEGPNTTANDLKGGSEVAGKVSAVAVTRDGTRLAYVMTTGTACGSIELHVRNLRTGADRTWRQSTPEYVDGTPAWAPDGRHLAFLVAGSYPRVLDTTAPGVSYAEDSVALDPTPDKRLRDDAQHRCRFGAVAYRGTDLVAVWTCDDGDRTSPDDVAVVLDQTTGRVTGTLFRLPPGPLVTHLAFDRSGEHALVDRGELLQRWDRGHDVYGVDTGRYPVTVAVW
jgi:hypothetical protein